MLKNYFLVTTRSHWKSRFFPGGDLKIFYNMEAALYESYGYTYNQVFSSASQALCATYTNPILSNRKN